MKTYITYAESARKFDVPRHVLTALADKGNLEIHVVDGRKMFIPEEVEDALELHDPDGQLCFTDDYNHFRDFGYSHERIAERFGLDLQTLMRRVHRLGIYRGTDYEVRAREVFDRLVESGVPFAAEALPCMHDEALGSSLVRSGVASGRIRKVRRRLSSLSTHNVPLVNVYEGVAA